MVVGRRPSKCASWKSSLNDVTIIIISFILYTGEYRVPIIYETKNMSKLEPFPWQILVYGNLYAGNGNINQYHPNSKPATYYY